LERATANLKSNRAGAIVVAVSGSGKTFFAGSGPLTHRGIPVIDADTILEYPPGDWWKDPEISRVVDSNNSSAILELAARDQCIILCPTDYCGIVEPDIIVQLDDDLLAANLAARNVPNQPDERERPHLSAITRSIIARWPDAEVAGTVAEAVSLAHSVITINAGEPPSAPPGPPSPMHIEGDTEEWSDTGYQPRSPLGGSPRSSMDMDDVRQALDETEYIQPAAPKAPVHTRWRQLFVDPPESAGDNNHAAEFHDGIHYTARQRAAAMNHQFKRSTGKLWVVYPGGDRVYEPEGCVDHMKGKCGRHEKCRYRHDIASQCPRFYHASGTLPDRAAACHDHNCPHTHTETNPLKHREDYVKEWKNK
jgi:hypothetical protein